MKFKGWAQSYLPILEGNAPHGCLSLKLFSDADTIDQMAQVFASTFEMERRQAALMSIHYAVAAVANLLIAPLALDGITLEAQAHQVGVVMEENGSLREVWIGKDYRVHSEVGIARLGTCLKNILEPIVEAAHQVTGFGRRGIDLVLFDAVERGCQRIGNAREVIPAPGWVKELLTALGDLKPKPARTFTVQTDDGPSIEMTIPRVCCMLARHATAHSCPTCPQHTPEDRVRVTEDWLKTLDPDGFRAETGRERILSSGQ